MATSATLMNEIIIWNEKLKSFQLKTKDDNGIFHGIFLLLYKNVVMTLSASKSTENI